MLAVAISFGSILISLSSLWRSMSPLQILLVLIKSVILVVGCFSIIEWVGKFCYSFGYFPKNSMEPKHTFIIARNPDSAVWKARKIIKKTNCDPILLRRGNTMYELKERKK